MTGVLSMTPWAAAGAQVSGTSGTLTLTNIITPGVITLTGTPGQYFAIMLQEAANSDSNYISSLRITITAPDGTVLSGGRMSPPTPTWTSTCPTACYGNSVTSLGPLATYPQGTTCTVTVQAAAMSPYGSGGNIDYTIITPIVKTTPLAIGGPAVDYYIGAQGQGVQGAGMYATCASPCTLRGVNQYSGAEADGIGVGITGQYTVWIYQETQQGGANAYGPLQGDFSIQIRPIAP